MSVTIRHLNADSSFLLIFSPRVSPSPFDLLSRNGAFSVLIDPWVTIGPSVVNAKWFAVTHRILPSAINDLSEIEEPDVVLVSQNKPDHCHKETLLQMRPEGKTLIAAEPGAAKAIKSWNHFDPHRVHALSRYDSRKRFGNTFRMPVPALSAEGQPGEVNIAFIPARNYMTGLHNAFGITYQPPTADKSIAPVATIDLPKRSLSPLIPISIPMDSPTKTWLGDSAMLSIADPDIPMTYMVDPRELSSMRSKGHRPQLSRSSNTKSSEILSPYAKAFIRPSMDGQVDHLSPEFDLQDINTTDFALSTPPPFSPQRTRDSPSSSVSTTETIATPGILPQYSLPNSPSLADLQARYSRIPQIRPARPKALSILYSPHGLPLSDLQPYIRHHLVPLPGALPLTCLMHSFDYASNPWWFGGNIMMGAEGGMEIAKALMARCWISAHDEEKDDRGVAVKLLRCDRNDAEKVRQSLSEVDERWSCDVRSLEVGEEICLTARNEKMSMKILEEVGLGVRLPVDVG